MELLAVDGPLNGQKSDGDAATWLPPNKAYRCAYVARQVALKATWGLWVTVAERDAIAGVLASCPGELVPTGSTASAGGGGAMTSSTALAPPPAAAPVPAPPPASAATSEAAPAPAPVPAPAQADDGGGTHPDMGICKAAKAIG